MTKEEIKKASAEDLAKRWLDLLFERINIQSTSYDNLLKLKYPDYVKYVMRQNKVFKRNIKESNLILRLRTEVSNLLNMIKRDDVKIPVPFPGYYIKEYLHEEKIAYEDFADDLGIEEIELIALLNGNIKINEELALKLSELIGTSVEVWTNLQKSYDEQNKLINNKTICLTKITLEDLLYSNLIPIRTCIYINLDNESVYCGESDLTLICNSISDIKYLKMEIKSISTCLLCDTPCIYIDLNCETDGDSK